MQRLGLSLSLLFLCVACSAGLVAAEEKTTEHPEFTETQVQFFEKEVEPILAKNCWKCHGEKEQVQGGLFLTSRAGMLAGGDSGSAVDLDSPADSLLLSAINYDLYEMPPDGKLPEAERNTLTKWVEMGLPFPKGREESSEKSHQESCKKSVQKSREEKGSQEKEGLEELVALSGRQRARGAGFQPVKSESRRVCELTG
jgi:hypothetical protein